MYIMTPSKAGFKWSTLDVRKTRFYSSEVGGFQKTDLVAKIGGITEAEHKHNKLVITTF